MKKAIEASLKESKKSVKPLVDDKKSVKPLMDDSFDEYQPTEISDENALRLANVPVRKKNERDKLVGFSCKDCEEYYKGRNLSDSRLHDLLQKCSRHRATVAPPTDSPQEMWKLDIDTSPMKTQIGPPLETKERRKNRLQRKKS